MLLFEHVLFFGSSYYRALLLGAVGGKGKVGMSGHHVLAEALEAGLIHESIASIRYSLWHHFKSPIWNTRHQQRLEDDGSGVHA